MGAFYQVTEDIIVYEYSPPRYSRPDNVGRASDEGLEFRARVSPAAWVALLGQYTLATSEDLEDIPSYVGHELPGHPRHNLWARVEGGIPRRAASRSSTSNRRSTPTWTTGESPSLGMPQSTWACAALCRARPPDVGGGSAQSIQSADRRPRTRATASPRHLRDGAFFNGQTAFE